ncbi:MAG TPA: amidohydrolase family protein [Tepidisphaeraceae bacterium]|jgi:cytosine/adenosine deaminase-related metal-dependent hydrolase
MPAGLRYFRARHVAMMTGFGVIDDGCVVVDNGRIAAVGPTRDLKPSHVDVDIDGLLTPGLTNAHTHLELTNVPRPPTPGTFQDWLLTTMASIRRPDVESFNRKRADAVREGVAQCLKFGVTFVGDITQNVDVVRPLLAASPLRAISYGECLGLGPRRERFDALMRQACDPATAAANVEIGTSPHAPYTVDADGYRRCTSGRDGERRNGWTTHVAETPDESAFIARRGGAFADLYRALGFDPGPGDGFAGSPVQWLYRHTRGTAGGLLAHVNYCSDADIDLIAQRRGAVVWCPRTHAYFGHPPHRWRDMMAAGVTVCVGTDSCASSPDLNVMDDVRLVRRQSPDVDAATLWSLVTTAASLALRGATLDRIQPSGSLTVGEQADLVAWPTRSGDPLAEVLETPGLHPSDVWIAGIPAHDMAGIG